MIKHKRSGFTIVELIVVLVVIAVLVTIAAVSYRSTQANSRDQKRKADATMLRSAVDEYFSDKGQYPTMSPACSPGNASECWRNEMWQLLVNEGYLARIPTPDTPSHAAGYNVAGNGNANYGWVRKTDGYAIYVPLEAETYCMTGKNMTSTWWSSARVCDF